MAIHSPGKLWKRDSKGSFILPRILFVDESGSSGFEGVPGTNIRKLMMLLTLQAPVSVEYFYVAWLTGKCTYPPAKVRNVARPGWRLPIPTGNKTVARFYILGSGKTKAFCHKNFNDIAMKNKRLPQRAHMKWTLLILHSNDSFWRLTQILFEICREIWW